QNGAVNVLPYRLDRENIFTSLRFNCSSQCIRYCGRRQACLDKQFGPPHEVFVLRRGEVHRRGLRLTNVVQAGIADHADDFQIPPVPRVHDIEAPADGVVISEEFLGEVLAHYGYAGRMVVVLPVKLTSLYPFGFRWRLTFRSECVRKPGLASRNFLSVRTKSPDPISNTNDNATCVTIKRRPSRLVPFPNVREPCWRATLGSS